MSLPKHWLDPEFNGVKICPPGAYMKTLQDFKDDVLAHFNSDHMRSYCPLCYGSPAILNSHRCNEGWNLYFDNELPYETRVKMAQDKMKQVFYRPIQFPLSYP